MFTSGKTLVVAALALACRAHAELHLLQLALEGAQPDSAIPQQPQQGCRTSVQGDACYEKIQWAMNVGIKEIPEWYPSLTANSSIEEFQRYMHSLDRLSHVCPEPCPVQKSDELRKAGSLTTGSQPDSAIPPQQGCRTSVQGDACYEKIQWAMSVGIKEVPEWYPSLTTNSSIEEFQRYLHSLDRLSHVCPEPCTAQKSDELRKAGSSGTGSQPDSAIPQQPQQGCRTVVQGDACYEKIQWAMGTGVKEVPEWYPSLTVNSSFEEFQQYLHSLDRLSHVCPEPCPVQKSDEQQEADSRIAGSQPDSAIPQPPQQACGTAVEGDACYEKVHMAMNIGIFWAPEMYSSLTVDSSFEEFQRYLHNLDRISPVCPEPCPVQKSDEQQKAGSLITESRPDPQQPQRGCRTSVEGDACYEKVRWAMRTGIAQTPEWYPSLTTNSSFEEFQQYLHSLDRLSRVCPQPCPAQKSDEKQKAGSLVTGSQPDSAIPQQPQQGCRTAVEGDACYQEVRWAMGNGILRTPQWYPSLTANSSFEEFQRYLHSLDRLSHVCPEPCPVQKSDEQQKAGSRIAGSQPDGAIPPQQGCRTAVEGDACYEKIQWAMGIGIMRNPEWYPSLTANSSIEEFQRFLHSLDRLSHVCPEPCPVPDSHARMTTGTPNPTAIQVGTPMPTEIHLDDLLEATHPLFVRSGRNCYCGNKIAQYSEDFESVEKCAAECLREAGCVSFGLHPWQSIWRGHCDLFDALCEDTDGHDLDTTCADPTPPDAPSVNFNIIPTTAPTPAPTFEADPCDVSDGSSPSSVYPCTCGSALCHTSEVCSANSCAPPTYLKLDWPCVMDPPISPWFIFSATAESGAPVYVNKDSLYLYWDPSCDGLQRDQDADKRPRWIFDTDAPSLTAVRDLDGDGACEYFGHLGTFDKYGLPLGDSIWMVACDGTKANSTVSISYEAAVPTPAPTLVSGKPCTCEPGSCGLFPYMDLDGDGCLTEQEVNQVKEIAGKFLEMDEDKDGCVTQAECAASGPGYDLPLFPIKGPAECDYGYFFLENTGVCQECLNGETRRRRSEACTDCPAGKEDLGEFDNCISGVYLTGPILPGEDKVFINKDTDESGVLLTIGDGITMSTRNPGYYERLQIVGKVGFAPEPRLPYEPEHESLLRTRGPFFVLDHGVHKTFNKYDAIVSACTGVNGLDFAQMYPCGCGVEICNIGQKCDETCGNVGSNQTVLNPRDGTSYGNSGCCIGPPVAKSAWIPPTPAPTVSARGDPHLVNLQGEHFDINHAGEYTLLRLPQATNKPAEMELRATIAPEHKKPCTTYITQVELTGSWLGGKSVQVRSYLRSHSKNESDKFLGIRVLDPSSRDEAPWESISDWTDDEHVLFEQAEKKGFTAVLSKKQWTSRKSFQKGAPTIAGQFSIHFRNDEAGRQSMEPATIIIRQDIPIQEHLNMAVRHLSALGRADIGGLVGFDDHPESLEDISHECQRHRDGMDGNKGPHAKPAWKTRWERIKEDRSGSKEHNLGDLNDNEASASLIGRDLMCMCANRDAMDDSEDGLHDGVEVMEGFIADFQVGRFAEATWE